MSTIEQKISQAKAKLLVDHPYFGTLASKLELVVNDDIEAFKSNGVKLEYNSDYLQGLELSEMEFVFANGAMHASLAHEQRKNNRSGWLWQMATDYAINDMLVENGLDLPQRALYRVRFKGMYAEEIYAELKDDILREEDNLEYEADNAEDVQNNDNKNNKSEKSENPQTQEELQEEILQEQLLAEEAISLLESEFNKGEAPHTIERFFTLTSQGKIDWRDELKVAIDRFHKDDYVLIPPNKKFLHVGIYLPSCTSQRFKLVVAVDSSGSVDEKLLNTFLSELNFLMNTIQNYQIDLLVCDEKIQSHTTFYSGDILDVDLKGGGATDFRPVFDFVESELDDTKLLLYFTDLEGKFPSKTPSYDVKWIVPKYGEVPFGELIELDD
ncbi:MAG: VWA-like domain-containing protein [Sulfurimonas sp.]|uniref:vWA domain-containing protein n=1 Tax=Sulfurimonas sp. TaxID=2022749 RepID=UPI00262D3347|nr:VWA-like domain-containing protein [Sulfurimonas sp.]MCW8895751.1 VWA-like domain-containing protein [Sulfurimonas sp.]MCW8953440.1 VWA-like domain-containing protein [Sulfurimonas sp.]MCW9067044.1 VWA-like domain-containing protein [Sulfurimonas sp.]